MRKPILFCCVFLLLSGCRICEPESKSELVVSISFDDNCAGVYQNALPLMNKYGFRATMFVNSGNLDRPGYLTWEQLTDLYENYDWEIGGHTIHHTLLTNLTAAEAEEVVKADRDILKAHGFEPVSFALPSGLCPLDYYGIITHYFRNIRTTFNTSMHNPIDRTNLGAFSSIAPDNGQLYLNRIRSGIMDRENLVILYFHDISTNAPSEYNCTPAQFEKLLKGLADLQVRVLPLDEALSYLEGKE